CPVHLTKYMVYNTSQNASAQELCGRAEWTMDRITTQGFQELLAAQERYMDDFWRRSDVRVEDVRAVSKRIESRGIPESGLFMIHDARRAKEAAEMALSDDLRKRVVEAVTDGGMSRNAAAKRFGVSIASAVRWLHRFAA